MKKSQSNLAAVLLIVLIMAALFIFIQLAGLFPMFTKMIYGFSYYIDTNQAEACYNIYDKNDGDIAYSEILSDLDSDYMFDHICDTCTCRDGYDGKVCRAVSSGIGYRSFIELQLRQVFGMEKPEGDIAKSLEEPRCYRKGYEVNNYCSTNNFYDYDTDDDLLPDICDEKPASNEKRPQCHEGPIMAKDNAGDETIIGYVHMEPFKGDNGFQCVLAMCTDKVLLEEDERTFEKYCTADNTMSFQADFDLYPDRVTAMDDTTWKRQDSGEYKLSTDNKFAILIEDGQVLKLLEPDEQEFIGVKPEGTYTMYKYKGNEQEFQEMIKEYKG